MKSTKYILLGLVIGFLLVLAMGASYDKTYYTSSPIFEDGYGFYYGNGSDAQMTWNASGYLDWNVTGYVDMDLTSKFTMDFSAATDGSGGLKVSTTVPTGLQLYGGVYSQVTIAGTTDAAVAAFRGRIDLDSSSAPVGYMQTGRFTVEEVGADMSGAVVCPLVLETYCDAGGNDPSAHYMIRFNTSQGAEVPTAWIFASNPEAIAYTANVLHGSSSTDKTGAIKIHVGGATGVIYLYTYSTAGQ